MICGPLPVLRYNDPTEEKTKMHLYPTNNVTIISRNAKKFTVQVSIKENGKSRTRHFQLENQLAFQNYLALVRMHNPKEQNNHDFPLIA